MRNFITNTNKHFNIVFGHTNILILYSNDNNDINDSNYLFNPSNYVQINFKLI